MTRTTPKTPRADLSQKLWFPRMGENRAATLYRPKRAALRLVPKPKGKTP